MKTKTFKQFLRSTVASGKHYFLKKDAMSGVSLTSAQFNVVASRLSKEKLIRHLSHGFFIIVSDANSHFGNPDVTQFLDKYMEYINTRYYLSLLTGALYYGASHQQSQTFYVITERPLKNIVFDRVTISFFSLTHRFANASYTKWDFNTGSLNIATIVQVCIDLVTFYEECGYWNNVYTVLSKIILDNRGRELQPTKLATLISLVKTTELQRLGYIFDLITDRSSIDFTKKDKKELDDIIKSGDDYLSYLGEKQSEVNKKLQYIKAFKLAQVVKSELDKRKVYQALLSPSELPEGVSNTKWKLIINDIIESDL